MASCRQDKLMDLIHYRRCQMHSIAGEKGISHPEVLIASQKLDELIVAYYRLKKRAVRKKN